jgi:hypothetical protein
MDTSKLPLLSLELYVSPRYVLVECETRREQFVVRVRRSDGHLEGLVEQFSENEVQKFVVFSRFTAVALKRYRGGV